jgi:hypothetical protein
LIQLLMMVPWAISLRSTISNIRNSPHFVKIYGRRRGLGVWGRLIPPRRTQKLQDAAPAGSSLNLPWSLINRMFITTTGGKDASDKYHK